jgi:4-carboxymuconolactone decarboxylase
MVLANRPQDAGVAVLRPKVDLLVQLGALLALGAATSSLRATVERAIEAGATEAEIVGVLIAVAPAVGLARVVLTAPRLAVAIGYDLEADE